MKEKKNSNTLLTIVIITLTAAALCAIFSIIRTEVIMQGTKKEVIEPSELLENTSSMERMNTGWRVVYEDGTSEDVTLPCSIKTVAGQSIELRRNMSDARLIDAVIGFDNNRYGIIISADGKRLYQANTTELSDQIKYTGYRFVVIPRETNEIEIKYTSSENGIYVLGEMEFGDIHDAKYEIIASELITIISLIFFILLGLLFLGFLIYYLAKKEYKTRFSCILVFLICTVLWRSADSNLPVLVKIDQEVAGMVCYLALMILPIPMILFVMHTIKGESRLLEVMTIIGALNVIVQTVLSLTGTVELQYMLVVSHILVYVDIATCIMTLRKNRLVYGGNRENNLIEAGVICLSLCAINAMLMYWTGSHENYKNSLVAGIIIFLILLFAATLSTNMKRRREEEQKISEAKIYKELATHDQLTGLKNRRAFEQKLRETEAEQQEANGAVLIMMDINGLKSTNDQYGHLAGDELIITTARLIESVYGNDGECYRIGGDEFVVVMNNPKNSVNYYSAMLNKKIAAHNETSRWKISIASGYSCMFKSTGERLSVSEWKQEADIKMYRNKVSMNTGDDRNLARDLQNIIDCIVTTLEARDEYTADHSARVSELSLFIGSRLGISSATLYNVEKAASLHDIGKVGIPDSILRKAGPLTDEEFGIVKRHSEIGADIISKAQGMYDISQIILHHHERYDGRGYPDGISGTDIPLESRIIAIADSIDAMTSKRVYRDSMSIDECKAEIERNIGTQFDPAIARIVLKNWSGIADIVMLHPKRLLQEDDANGGGNIDQLAAFADKKTYERRALS